MANFNHSRPSDPYEDLHWNMVHAHNSFKVGYEHLVGLLDQPEKWQGDTVNFIGYASAWAECIEDHHSTEEVAIFPELQKKMDIHTEQEQHKQIHEGIEGILAYTKAAQADPKTFDAQKLKAMMVGLKDILWTHLDEEVEHIKVENMKAAGFTSQELTTIIKALDTTAKKNGNPYIVLPFMTGHTPPDMQPLWPDLPWILRKLVIPYVFARKHSGYWKYNPY